jgi:hypothetical protein
MGNITDGTKTERRGRALQRVNAPKNLRRELAAAAAIEPYGPKLLEIAFEFLDDLLGVADEETLLVSH